jgi:hypothetical protein
MSGLRFALGIMLVVSYVTAITEFTRAYGQTEEGRIHLQSIPTDKNNGNVKVVKEQWTTVFNQLLSESHEGSIDN